MPLLATRGVSGTAWQTGPTSRNRQALALGVTSGGFVGALTFQAPAWLLFATLCVLCGTAVLLRWQLTGGVTVEGTCIRYPQLTARHGHSSPAAVYSFELDDVAGVHLPSHLSAERALEHLTFVLKDGTPMPASDVWAHRTVRPLTVALLTELEHRGAAIHAEQVLLRTLASRFGRPRR